MSGRMRGSLVGTIAWLVGGGAAISSWTEWIERLLCERDMGRLAGGAGSAQGPDGHVQRQNSE